MLRLRLLSALGLALLLMPVNNVYAQSEESSENERPAENRDTPNDRSKTKKRRPSTRSRSNRNSGSKKSNTRNTGSKKRRPVASRSPGIFTAEAALKAYYDSNFGQFSDRDFDAFANGSVDPRYSNGTYNRFRISSLDDFVLQPKIDFSVRGRPLAGRFAEATIYYKVDVPILNNDYINQRPGLAARFQIYQSFFGYGGFEFLPYVPGRNLPLYDDQGDIIGYTEDWQKGYNLSIGLGYIVPKLLKATAGYRFDWENHPTDFTERDGAAHNIVGDVLVYAWPPILKTELEFGYRVYDCIGDLDSTTTVEPSISSVTISYNLDVMAAAYNIKDTGAGEVGVGFGQQMIDFTSPYDDDPGHKGRQDVVTELSIYFGHSFGLGLILRLEYLYRYRVTNLDDTVAEEIYEVTEFSQSQIGLSAVYNFGSFGPTAGP